MAGGRLFGLSEVSGAAGDLGLLLPLTLGVIVVGGAAPAPVFAGFAILYLISALVYRLPIPVQPMKAIAAVALATGASAATIAASGVLVGATLVVLGTSGLISRLDRLVPRSILAGLQLGLGLSLLSVAVRLMQTSPGFAVIGIATVFGAMLSRRGPAALILLATAIGAGHFFPLPHLAVPGGAWTWALPGLPSAEEMRTALIGLAVPQIALTITNAILLTALVANDLYGAAAARVTPRRLCLTSGIANLVLAPLGALPMCHGAGGVAAHWRHGARGWGAPVMLSALCACLAIVPGLGAWSISLIPTAALGVLLLVAAVELAASRRVFESLPSCRPVIAATAAATALINPVAGLAVGTAAEVVRTLLLRHLDRQRESGPVPGSAANHEPR